MTDIKPMTPEEMKEIDEEIRRERNEEAYYTAMEERYFEWLSYEKARLKEEFIKDNEDDFNEYCKGVYRSCTDYKI